MENERSLDVSSDCKLNATEGSSNHISCEVLENNGNILFKNNKRRGRPSKRIKQLSVSNGTEVISQCNPNVTNSGDTNTKNVLKLFPIFSKASNLRTELNLPEEKSTEVSSQRRESTKREGLEEASTDDHNLGKKDQGETNAGNKKVTPHKRKRKRSDKNDKVRLDSQDCALGSKESTLEGIAPKQVFPESSTKDSKIISFESTNASSEKNCKLFPIFTSPKPASLVAKSEVAASTPIEEQPKKRGRKPGSKLLNRPETAKSDVTASNSGNTSKKRGRKPGSSLFSNHGIVLSSIPNIETEPKKRGRKPGSSLLKETKAEIISAAELPDDSVIKSEKRKRQKIALYEPEDNLIEDNVSVLLSSLSGCTTTSPILKSKSGLSVAKALTNMINKTHKKKKGRKTQNLSPVELVKNISAPLDFITSTPVKPHEKSMSTTKPDDDLSVSLSLNSTPIKAVQITEMIKNEFPIFLDSVTSAPGISPLSNIPIDDLHLLIPPKKKSNSLSLTPNPKSKKRSNISETIEVSSRRTSSRLQNKSFSFVNDNSNSSHASIISPSKNLEIDENGTNDKCPSRKPRNKLKSKRLKVLPPNHEVLENINSDKDIKLFPLFTQFQGTTIMNDGVKKVNFITKEKKRSTLKRSSTRKSMPITLSGENSDPEIVIVEEVKDKKSNKVQLSSKIDNCADSNDSVQELKVNHTSNQSKVSIDKLSLKSDSHKITQEATSKIDTVKQSSTFLRHLENHFTFPLQSHCNVAMDTLESNAFKHFIINDEETETDIKIPMWSGIIGITEVKSLKGMNDSKNLREDISVISSENINGKSVKMIKENDDSLWTDIASDYNLKEVVSESTICELNLWLKQWKSKFTKRVKSGQCDKDESLDNFSSDSNDSDIDENSNSIIIMGPPGSGKTSLVFSLANEHGFKVLEVNASSCRNGRNISHQLKEALESYHVENTKVADIDFIQQPNEKGSAKDFKENKEFKNNKPKKGILSFLKTEKDDIKGRKKNAPEKKSLQVKSKTSSDSSIQDQKGRKSAKKMKDQSNLESSKKSGETKKDSNLCTISSQTIILFDDIDVVFEEDEGLWSTIRGFLRISKKPVIFTASRNLEIVRANLDFDIRVLHLKPMIEDFAIEKINSQCKKYNRQSTNVNIKMMVPYNSNDLRRNLLHTQFWSQSLSNRRIDLPINFENHLSVNTLLSASSDFSVMDFTPLIFKRTSNSFSHVISQFHEIGYDVLHSNLFPIFNVTSAVEGKEMWQVAHKLAVDTAQLSDSPDNDSSVISQATKKNIKSDLWREACEIFELKKNSLQNGSCSNDLSIFFDILEDFSFIDCVKGVSSTYMDWISIPERIKKWNLGLPMCNDYDFKVYNDFAVDLISMIQILSLQVAKTKPLKCKLIKVENEALILEHPFMNIFNFKTESKMDCIASALPASLYLNKTVLNLDYLSTLKLICQEESLKQSKSGKRSNRFLHYFDSISLLIDKYQIEQILNGFDKS